MDMLYYLCDKMNLYIKFLSEVTIMDKNEEYIKLDEFEQILEDNFENAVPISANEKAKTLSMLKDVAKNYQQKSDNL